MNATAANLIDRVLPPQSGLRRRVCEMGAREAVLRYVLRPAVAQERVEQRPDGLVRCPACSIAERSGPS